jgi:hypothetical protein
MPLLKNRIGLSLLLILPGASLWEFYRKPVTGPLYTAAVNDYRNGHYNNSLELLKRSYKIDLNDASVLPLRAGTISKWEGRNRPLSASAVPFPSLMARALMRRCGCFGGSVPSAAGASRLPYKSTNGLL